MRDFIRKLAYAIYQALSTPPYTRDVPSPRDIIPKSDINHDSLRCILTIKNIPPTIWLTDVADTNSMDPTIDMGHTAILTNNIIYENLAVGDVVVYNVGSRDIIHRIIKIETDSKGRKYTLKGDNNPSPDACVVRDSHIEWLLLGVLY